VTYIWTDYLAKVSEEWNSDIGFGRTVRSGHRSKHLEEFLDSKVHTVITVCGYADQACPMFPGMVKRYHWGFDDPAKGTGSEEEVFAVFRRVRDEIGKVFGAYAAGISLGMQFSR
jgi:arsenate reductase